MCYKNSFQTEKGVRDHKLLTDLWEWHWDFYFFEIWFYIEMLNDKLFLYAMGQYQLQMLQKAQMASMAKASCTKKMIDCFSLMC